MVCVCVYVASVTSRVSREHMLNKHRPPVVYKYSFRSYGCKCSCKLCNWTSFERLHNLTNWWHQSMPFHVDARKNSVKAHRVIENHLAQCIWWRKLVFKTDVDLDKMFRTWTLKFYKRFMLKFNILLRTLTNQNWIKMWPFHFSIV